MSTANFYEVLAAYKRNHRQLFVDRDVLMAHQRRYLHRLLKETLPFSPFYKRFLSTPMDSWPVITGHLLMKNFNQINTVGALYNESFAKAVRADISRDYSHFVGYNSYTPLLSSGTKSRRHVFVMNREEQIDRIGDVLARMFPHGFNRKMSVAYFFRNNNSPHFVMNTDIIDFQAYDLFSSFENLLRRLEYQQPDIIVAPVSVLLHMALLKIDGKLRVSNHKVYTVGEVLTPRDKIVLRRAFGEVGEIYYAVEGLLGMTCEHGKLHLNEEKYFFEKEWLDPYRFTAVITNFTASTLPLVRYRLDDVFYADPTPCHCGRVSQVVRMIEGRLDDVLMLPARNGQKRVMVYPSINHDILSKVLPWRCEYRLIQSHPNVLHFSAAADEQTLQTCCSYLKNRWAGMGVHIRQLHWNINPFLPAFRWEEKKQRRIQRLPFTTTKDSQTVNPIKKANHRRRHHRKSISTTKNTPFVTE